MNKKYFFIIALISCLFLGFAESVFNSYAGASLDIGAKENNEKGIALKLNGVFAGQYTLDNSFSIRGQFSVTTDDIFDNGIFQDTPAWFTINELSATYRFLTETVNHQASIFIGEFESFGSDSFVKKYFGSRNFSSPILLPYLGLDTVGMIKFDGIGFAYSVKFPSPKALGLYFYYDITEEENQISGELEDVKKLNGALRFSAAWDSIILDADFGISLPLKTKTSSGEDVILVIEYAELHTGISLLLGNNPITNLFLQVGINKLDLNPKSITPILSIEDVYLFMEPRFTTKYLKCNVAFFCLPTAVLSELQFINNPIGCNISFTSQPFIMFGKNADFGCNFTVSTANLTSAEITNYDFQITPYINLYAFNGVFNVMTTINTMDFKKPSFFTLSLGYKNYLWEK